MTKPPAVIIVVRHGARLDAADRQWHLTSPTPYDPPLTYGGWLQCRTLGTRIAELLQARAAAHDKSRTEVEQDGEAAGPGRPHKTHKQDNRHASMQKKKHSIIIHTSPFLRCVQTSIAISAGISQHTGSLSSKSREPETATRGQSRQPVANNDPPSKGASSHLAIVDEEENEEPTAEARVPVSKPLPKSRLRIDAFLGEWFTPDYYEHITPPPDSVLMLAGAKAELLRRTSSVNISLNDPHVAQNFFPGGWNNFATDSSIDENGDDLDLNGLSLSPPPKRERANTYSSGENGSRPLFGRRSVSASGGDSGYTPPVPGYAISPTDPIPSGYVAHARDACVSVDYQWDSTRPPHDWGNGGEYGEEWSAMHKRFRKGLQSMVDWYRQHSDSLHQSKGHLKVLHPKATEPDDDTTDTALIIVTHGAGCNALLGAITNQPVLMDVGMASLTMAVYRSAPSPQAPAQEEQSQSKHHPDKHQETSETGLSTDYEVLLTASTDHLRTQSRASLISPFQLRRRGTASAIPTQTGPLKGSSYRPAARYRLNPPTDFNASPLDTSPGTFSLPGPAMSEGPGRSASGLWAKPDSPTASRKESQPEVRPVAEVAEDEIEKENRKSPSDTSHMEDSNNGGTGGHSPGLWGSLPPSLARNNDSEEVQRRESGHKRSWTVAHHQAGTIPSA